MPPFFDLSAFSAAAHAADSDGGGADPSRDDDVDDEGARRLHRALDDAVDERVITAAQRDGVLAIDRTQSVADPSVSPAAALEARPGFHWVTVAYVLGALIVLLAFGWFLADRWTSLGERGVLALAVGYAALFAGVSRWLYARGWRVAGGWAAVCAVGMTPVIVWLLQSVLGLWPGAGRHGVTSYDIGGPGDGDETRRMAQAAQALVTELATIAVALIALRRLRVAALVTPIAAALPFVPFHLLAATVEPAVRPHASAWLLAATAAAIFWLAYAVARHTHLTPAERRLAPDAPDYARWLYASAMVCTLFAVFSLWERYPGDRHALSALALALVAGSLVLRRRSVLATGVLLLLGYLVWLANELFRGSVAFPIALATIGLTTILLTVWLQARFPGLVRRGHALVNAPRLPGHHLLPALAVAFALLMMLPARAADREDAVAQRWQQERWRRTMTRDSAAAATAAATRRNRPRPTPAAPATSGP